MSYFAKFLGNKSPLLTKTSDFSVPIVNLDDSFLSSPENSANATDAEESSEFQLNHRIDELTNRINSLEKVLSIAKNENVSLSKKIFELESMLCEKNRIIDNFSDLHSEKDKLQTSQDSLQASQSASTNEPNLNQHKYDQVKPQGNGFSSFANIADDIDALINEGWLTDTILDAGLNLIHKLNKDVLSLSPSLSYVLRNCNGIDLASHFDNLSITNYNWVTGFVNNGFENCFLKKNPNNENHNPDNESRWIPGSFVIGTHWSLIVFDLKNRCCFHLDSINGKNVSFAIKMMNNFEDYLKLKFRFVPLITPHQKNNFDCGVEAFGNLLQFLNFSKVNQSLDNFVLRENNCINLRKGLLEGVLHLHFNRNIDRDSNFFDSYNYSQIFFPFYNKKDDVIEPNNIVVNSFDNSVSDVNTNVVHSNVLNFSNSINTKTEPASSRVLLIGDSHCRGLCKKLQMALPCNFELFSFTKPNAPLSAVISELVSHTKNFTKNDYVFILGGGNDIPSKTFKFSLSTGLNLIQVIAEKTNVFLFNIFKRFDRPRLNYLIRVANSFINSHIKTFQMKINFLKPQLKRSYFTKHGLHLNWYGKRVICNFIYDILYDCTVKSQSFLAMD